MRTQKVLLFLLIAVHLPFQGSSQSNLNKSSSSNNVADLSSLGKVWGLLKYHHPAVANGTLDWDAALLGILPRYQQASDKNLRNEILMTMLKDLGSIPTPNKADSLIKDLKSKPDFAWIQKSGFSKELTKALLDVSKNRIKGKQKYLQPYSMDGMTISIITDELPYADLSKLTEGHKLIAVFRWWNIIEYFYPYKYLTAEKWETYLDKFIAEALLSKDEISYVRLVQKMVASIRDSHAYAVSRKTEEIIGFFSMPITLKFIGNQAVVNSVDTVKYKMGNIHRGDVLTSINGSTITKLLDEQRPYISASNEAIIKREAASRFNRSPDSVVKITLVSADGDSKDLSLKTYPLDASFAVKRYDFAHQRDSSFFIKDEILYINMGKFTDDHAKTVIPKIKALKGVVIDGRQYPPKGGGSISMVLDEVLMDKKRDMAIFSTVIEGYPGFFKYTEPMQSGEDNPDYFKGLTTLLINEQTQSTGEFMAMAIKLVPNMKVIGSTTSGADGNVTQRFQLPGGIATNFTSLGVYYPDKGKTQQIGIISDHKVEQTLEGFRAGKDEMLEKAIELINGFKRL